MLPSGRMSQTVKVLAFAGARDVVGAAELAFSLCEPCTSAQLLAAICEQFPGLSPHRRSLRLAVNGHYAEPETTVSPGDEVALIPPVAGG